MKPLVTALIDTFNHEKYIEQALVSVVEQGLSPSELEIVVVDDGSTDKTPEIIQKFVPRVKHVQKKNGGQASAFNAGFAEAHGPIIAPLDGDDWWAEGKLVAVLEAFQQNPQVSAVSHAYYKFYESTKDFKAVGPPAPTLLNLATPEAARLASRDWAFLATGALTVRRQLMEQIIPIPEKLVFLADAPINVASLAGGVLVLPQVLSYYRCHSDNLFAVEPADVAKMRRRYDMVDVTFGVLRPMLLRLGVPEECVSAFVDPAWIYDNRFCLRNFGGSRLKTFRTEMRYLHSQDKNATIGYRIFSYFVLGGASLLLPPRRFYELRDWYGQRNLGRFHRWIVRRKMRTRDGSSLRAG
jgi:glycosyltransferase involved in cell wall biosynthesis